MRHLLDQLGGEALRFGQSVIVADQHDIGALYLRVKFLPTEHPSVLAKGLREFPEVLSAGGGIPRLDLASHLGQRPNLRRCPSSFTIGRGLHLDSLLHAPYAQDLDPGQRAVRAGKGAPRTQGALPDSPHNLTIAATGASGAIFLRHILAALDRDARVKIVNFIASDGALRVLAEELDLRGRSDLVRQVVGRQRVSGKIRQQSNADIGANIASGSYPSDAMVVIPCSMGTLSRIAQGTASQLIERAADVCLKEKRPLVLCVRETPLNKIHIRNMYRAADAGASLFPLIPAYYFRPATLDQMAHELACRVLAHIGLPQADAYRWKG
ncbi:MAG: UbiX family flavin prenyltransferase [Acidobacteria bacterium]|nr:UbiX family flavin prenyltransferase [Acidobacteriota bacterium]